MRQENHLRGERRSSRAPDPSDLGWDDSLYQEGKGAEESAGATEGGRGGRGEDGDDRRVPAPRDGNGRPGGGTPAPRKRRRGMRILRWTALALAVLILGVAAAGYLYYQHLNGNLKKDELNLGKHRLDKIAPNKDGQTPLNILLLGSDSRNSKENVKLGGSRSDVGRKPLADVQMLLHVSADRSNMSVVSIPRDTRVKIPQCVDNDDTIYPESQSRIINSSLQNGGPGCTVATWEELTGVPIDHFMMIDFAGVVDMADAVGGVPVCVRSNVYDDNSGLRLEKGTQKVKGEQALQWLRTRHGFEDGSDIGRAKAQHMYMNAMVRQLKSGTKLSDPGKLMSLAEAATQALTVDKGLGTVGKLYDLANDIKRVPTERITMATMPWVPDPWNSAHVIPKPGESEQLFSLIRSDVALDGKDKKKPSPDASPTPSDAAAPKGEIPVTVQNGTGTITLAAVRGRAAAIAGALVNDGFSKATADVTRKSQADTTITYPSANLQGDALAVAKALDLPKSAVRMSSSVTQVTLVIGADWREGLVYPESEKDGKADADKILEGADALNGADEKGCMEVNPAYTF